MADTDIQALKARIPLSALIGSSIALEKNGREHVASCPFHQDDTPSFTVVDAKGFFHCFGCGAHGDHIDWLEDYVKLDTRAAIERLRAWTGTEAQIVAHPRAAGRDAATAEWRPILPVPEDAPALIDHEGRARVFNPKRAGTAKEWTTLRPAHVAAYRDGQGRLLGYVLRCEFGHGDKFTPQVTWCGNAAGETRWCIMHMPRPRPLYGLDRLTAAPAANVLLVEGEKKCDAAQALLPELVVMCWPGGGNGRAYVDWTPLAGRTVMLWPDHDDPGAAAMEGDFTSRGDVRPGVAQMIEPIAAGVRVVDVPAGQPKGWDVGDAVTEGWTAERLRTFLRGSLRAARAPDPEARRDEISPAATASQDKPNPAPAEPPAASQLPAAPAQPTSTAPAPRPDPGPPVELPPRRSGGEPRAPDYSDIALTLWFVGEHKDRLRYVSGWGKWLLWTGKRWLVDEKLKVTDLVRRLCQVAAYEATFANARNAPTTARGVASRKTVDAVERLARAHTALAATVRQWDTDPMLLNTPGGVVDLRTGAMRPHRPEDCMTKIAAVAPADQSRCPRWLDFLARVMNGDAELIACLRRICGYCLTGDTSAHAMFFGYGTGANGKSVFINTLMGIMADYARSAAMEVFMASNQDRHPTELADLRGARLVTSVETEQGRRWAESRIKQMTGDDPIKARFMRQDFFEYRPQFKLVIAGNHKPGLRGVDEAIRRRLHLIPFTVTIPAHERDPRLQDKLRAEWPAILRWMIEGCLEWQRIGLKPPAAVLAATEDYLEEEDTFAQWLNDCCELAPGAWTATQTLFASWKSWAERAGEHAGTQKKFSHVMQARGFAWSKRNIGRGFVDIRLVSDGPGSEPPNDLWERG